MQEFDLVDLNLDYWMAKRDRSRIAKNLRDRKTPLSPEYCEKIADLIDPDQLHRVGRPPLSLFKHLGEVACGTKQYRKNITKMAFIHVDAFHRSLVGHPGYGIPDIETAKQATCATFSISKRTYDNIFKQCKSHSLYQESKNLTSEILKKHPR